MAALLSACAEPVPPARVDYVGLWQGEGVRLRITAAGHVEYERHRDGQRVAINAPIRRFEGDDFVVGFGPFTTTFEVSAPPRRQGATWTMVVDKVLLRRTDRSGEIRA
ncbi:MAG TPA: hypothetical protein VLC53_02805 [Myxococcota bacterium]|nr:hypothetical protein [Myxococcota bacterium]